MKKKLGIIACVVLVIAMFAVIIVDKTNNNPPLTN